MRISVRIYATTSGVKVDFLFLSVRLSDMTDELRITIVNETSFSNVCFCVITPLMGVFVKENKVFGF